MQTVWIPDSATRLLVQIVWYWRLLSMKNYRQKSRFLAKLVLVIRVDTYNLAS